MPCFHPLTAYRSLTLTTENGKSLISFNRDDIVTHPYEKINLRCAQCFGCRMDRSKQWALRCLHEASLFENNCFITLTFNDENLNERHSLDPRDFVLFMKRLRKEFTGIECVTSSTTGEKTFPIRFFHCGEYGEKLTRPHHHACLFNFSFQDLELWPTRNRCKVYRSSALEKLWTAGFSTIGEVTFESAAYVARYITKKVNGQHAASHYIRGDPDTGEAYYLEPEYITMSNRPGLGSRWFEKYAGDVYPKDFITVAGFKFKTPKYYDSLYDITEPMKMARVKRKRKLASIKDAANNTGRRLKARAAVARAKAKNLVREYEDGTENVLYV